MKMYSSQPIELYIIFRHSHCQAENCEKIVKKKKNAIVEVYRFAFCGMIRIKIFPEAG